MKNVIISALASICIVLLSCTKDPQVTAGNTISNSYVVSTLAGNGQEGYLDGPGNLAQFKSLINIVADPQGNVYVADAFNYVIRKISPSGVVSTLAGDGVYGFVNGSGSMARFRYPTRITIDPQGNLYVVDNYRIRKITTDGLVTTFAGGETMGSINGADTAARFYSISSITSDRMGNVYVKESGLGNGGTLKIRKITPTGVVSTFSEDAILSISLTTDNANNIYSGGSYYDGSIYRYSPLGVKSTVKQMEGFLTSLGRDEQGNFYYTEGGPFSFSYKHQLFKVSSSGEISVIAGIEASGYADGEGNISKFAYPTSLTIDAQGNIFVADVGNLRIRKITKK